jgi:hypothetical protein
MTARDALIAARQKIEKPECWTQDVSARDSDGEPCEAWSPKAVCWCASGAVDEVTFDAEIESQALAALRAALQQAPGTTFSASVSI